MRASSLRAILPAACVVLAGCDLGTGSATDPSAVAIVPAFADLDAIGDTLSLTAEVRNEDGDLLSAAGVTWTVEDQSVAEVSAAGVVTAIANGETTITAASGGASRTIAVEVVQSAAILELESGDAQAGAAGEELAAPLVVRAFDRLDNPAADVLVTFQVEQGDGSVSLTEVATDSAGRASSTWTLGEQAAAAQRVRAFVSFRVEASVVFVATAEAGAPAAIVDVSGDAQSAPRGTALLEPLVVRVDDALGNPVGGASVAFATGQGTLLPVAPVTDDAGMASSAWTLGNALGAQSATATVGSLAPVIFDATATETPDSIAVLRGDGQSGTVGSELTDAPAIRVLDALGAPVPLLDVQFAAPGSILEAALGGETGDTLVVRTGIDGVAALGEWILGTTPGTYAMSVRIPGLPPLALSATALLGPPTQIVRVSGDGQRGAASLPLADSLVVRVTDAFANSVPGVTVSFTPAAQNGAASPTQAVTDAGGRAATQWTIGSTTSAQFLTASIPGTSVAFSAGILGLGGLEIELQYIHQPTPAQEEFFDDAIVRWATLIPGRLTPQSVNIAAGACGAGSPAINRVVDDIVVLVRIAAIDNAFGTLASAGPCILRPGGGLPVVAQLTVDAADIGRAQADETLDDLLIHELAHALGFGTLWSVRGFLVNPSLPSNRGTDTHFDGPNAIAAFDLIGGGAYAEGEKVPVENRVGGAGTRDGHWRLSVFENELMTGFMSTTSPLSRVTVASLRDLGYEVDELAADPFQVGPFPAPAQAPALETATPLGDDILRGPVYILGPDGRVRGVLDP